MHQRRQSQSSPEHRLMRRRRTTTARRRWWWSWFPSAEVDLQSEATYCSYTSLMLKTKWEKNRQANKSIWHSKTRQTTKNWSWRVTSSPYHLLVSSKLADLKAKRKRELIYKKCFCCKTKEVLLKTWNFKVVALKAAATALSFTAQKLISCTERIKV